MKLIHTVTLQTGLVLKHYMQTSGKILIQVDRSVETK